MHFCCMYGIFATPIEVFKFNTSQLNEGNLLIILGRLCEGRVTLLIEHTVVGLYITGNFVKMHC